MTFPAPGGLSQVSFEAIGTTVSMVVIDRAQLDAAVVILRSELALIDRAASRFRPDSELCALNAGAGKATEVSPVLFRAISEALRAARLTDGLVDPTVGQALMHHLIDPATGPSAAEYWRTVSVAAARCLDANIASSAAILLGPDAPGWLAERALPARLVDPAGRVTQVGGWPDDAELGVTTELACGGG